MSAPALPAVRGRADRAWLAWLLGGLIGANAAAWLWALAAARGDPVFLGAAGVAWLFGLRHALDADHIAAIDNVTRRLAPTRRRSAAVGLFFSLGHASLVVLACLAAGLLSARAGQTFAVLQRWGGLAGSLVSAAVLLAVAAANALALTRTLRALGRDAAVAGPAHPGGLVTRAVRPLLRAISRPWHMYPLGFLFGLGFDTATEVGLLAIAARHASAALAGLLVFPALFTAGMCLVDTSDSILMARAYGWAFQRPRRRLLYNAVVTATSVLAAASVAVVQLAGLLPTGPAGPWSWLALANSHFGALGVSIAVALTTIWLAARAIEGLGRRR